MLHHPRLRRVGRILMPLVALSFCSCGAGGPKLYPVRGQVFVGGRPAAGAVVVFHPLHPPGPADWRPSGRVGADGSFTLATFAAGDGAPAGEYAVAVAWTGDPSEANPVTGELPVKLSPAYGAVAATPLRAAVHDGPNVLPAFNLPN